ncbi:MAG TPA: glycosyltransferase [Terracidiphilus sp.]|nr:glycosyltransferase [Terracidiphilus sp.]
MRIAYMLTSLGFGGAERQVVALAERMAARGHQVLLIVLRCRAEHVWPTNVDVVYLDMSKSPAGVVSGLVRGRRVLCDFRPDLVHCHTFHANMAGRLLCVAGAFPRTLSTIHNVYEGPWHRTLAYGLTDRLAIHTTAVSRAVATRSIESGVVAGSKCSVLTNGIDVALFAKDGGRRDAMRTELNAGSNFIWLAAGRIAAAKDYPNLLGAFARVLAVVSQTRLWVAGEGSDQEGELVRNLAAQEGLTEHIDWLGLRDEMPAVFDGADAFVLGSAWEGMPLVVGEAMAMEKPVVATDVGGVRELAGDAGMIVPPNDAGALAGAMLYVMRKSQEELSVMGEAARARIRKHFDMNAKAAEWEALYSRLLAMPGSLPIA